VKIKYLGHSAFLITSEAGVRIITDPYTPNDRIKLAAPSETADIVTMSHCHGDHSNIMAIKGNPQGIMCYGKWNIKGIDIQGIAAYHDSAEGKKAGSNIIYCFNIDGIKVCHFGDLGHMLSDAQIAELGKVDVLLTPMGGNYTIDAATATAIMNKLKPAVTVPMHYKNAKVDYPVETVDSFIKDKKNVVTPDSSEIELQKGKLPKPEIVVLKPAL
jgi:L-ascorbate metabolism protein UlaG (beta-lactamase superfamily)